MAEDLTIRFHRRAQFGSGGPLGVLALDKVSFQLCQGEVLGIVGESGSGKTTLARVICGIITADAGKLAFGESIKKPSRDVQMVFQNPLEALDPRMTIAESLSEPLKINRFEEGHDKIIKEVLAAVNLPSDVLGRTPEALSGGQLQRVVIARAIVLRPKLLVCDEPTSSLDLSVQAKILNLLLDLKDSLSLTLIFISHDLQIVKSISDRILVMRSGIIVESGETETVCSRPSHPYTRELTALAGKS